MGIATILNSFPRPNRVLAPVLVLIACTSASAGPVFHNGSVTSGGTGEVAIDFFTDSPDGALFTATNFRENASLISTYEYQAPVEPPLLFFALAIRNSTAIAWQSFHVDLFGADFFGFNHGIPGGPLARTLDPVVFGGIGSQDILLAVPDNPGAISISSSGIQRDGENASLWIFFDDVVDPDESFQLAFWIDDVGLSETNFTMHQAPIPVPEPGSLLLGLFAFGALLPAKKRSR